MKIFRKKIIMLFILVDPLEKMELTGVVIVLKLKMLWLK